MNITDSTLANEIKDVYVSDHGNFYFLDGIVISEINEGVTYTWEEASKAIDAAKEFYGNNVTVTYISNRVNKYSIKPSDWLKFYRNDNNLNGYAVVTNSENSWFNALMEKLFSVAEIVRFEDLYEAIKWAKHKNNTNSKSNLAS
ncbi:hypothetical protein [Olleya sp. R77988]|uniref:hypothetical protein n=1 Tax=Olleya sp. R77988 TaxID=3093875 RepID=UPI0037C9AC5A